MSIWIVEQRDKDFRGDDSMWEPRHWIDDEYASSKRKRAEEVRAWRLGSSWADHRAVEYVRKDSQD